jgi:hypothetical protein
MTSAYSTDLKLELMVTGENAGTWGDKTNTNLNLIQQAVAGYEQVTLSSGGTLALAMTQEALSNARNMVIKFATASIAASTICTIPDGIEKFYIFDATGLSNPANLTIKTASGTGFTLDAAKIYAAYADGTNLKEISLDTLGGTVGSAQIADDAITSAKIDDNAVLTAAISANQVTTAKIPDDAITTAKISALQVTSAKIANDAVGPDQLADTAVTAASYTLASITVDAQGRVTAASSGSAGGGGWIWNAAGFLQGSASGNYAASPSATKIGCYLQAGGGGGGTGNSHPAGSGGYGGAGYYHDDVTAPFSAPYSVGGRGNAGNPGNAGGATSFHNFAVNGGNGGAGETPSGGAPGSPGSAGNTDLIYDWSNNQTLAPMGSFPTSGEGGKLVWNNGLGGGRNNPGGAGWLWIWEG